MAGGGGLGVARGEGRAGFYRPVKGGGGVSLRVKAAGSR
jgi:hypothetical protein